MSSDTSLPEAQYVLPAPSSGFWPSLKLMWRVIYALMMRESRTRYGHSDLGYLWGLIDPIAQLVILVTVFTALGRRVPIQASLPVFFTLGILPYQFWRSCVIRGATAVQSNTPLLSYPQVKVLDVVIARTILDGATMIVIFIIFAVGLHYITGEPFGSWLGDPFQIGLVLITLFYFSLSFAIFSCGMARVFPPWTEIFNYASRPLWFTSGVFFTLQQLPSGFRSIAIFNPIAHLLEWIKSATMPDFHSTVYKPSFIYATATIVLLIGLILDRILRLIGHADETR